MTKGLHQLIEKTGHGAHHYFMHSPANFSWQRRAIESRKELGVPVTMKDVLTSSDYRLVVTANDWQNRHGAIWPAAGACSEKN